MPAPLITALSFIIELLLNMAQVVVIASVIISWVGADPYNPLVQTIQKLTEPMFRPFRGLSEKMNLPIDLSPMIVLLVITTIQRGLLPALKMALISP